MDWERFFRNLPPYLGREIFQFLIPESSQIQFRKFEIKHTFYSTLYEIAYIGDRKVENNQGKYLSRIPKKNGKHRYYITEIETQVIIIENNDREINFKLRDYHSVYVGKILDYALIVLFTQ